MNKKSATLLPIRAVVAVFLLLHLAPSLADTIDDYVRVEMANQHLPGMAIAVIRNGKPVKVKGYGAANVELKVPVTADTVFKIGSVSKQFIAAGVLLLAQDGKVSIDDPASKYLEGTPDSWRDITLKHLLTHTSGLVREAPGFSPLKTQTDADVIRTAYDVPLQSKPGEKWSYCNLGYFMLAEVIHKASGKPWPEFMNERIFKPLGMNATRTTDAIELVPNRASGYLYRDNKQQNVGPLVALRPSGAFLSTVNDLIKWDAALRTNTLLAKATQTQMWTPATLPDGSSTRYGFGWVVDDVREHQRVRHGGSLPGFRAEFSRYVDDGLSVIVLVNGDGARPDAFGLEIANQFITGLSPKREVTKLEPTMLAAYAGRYQMSPSNILSIAVDGAGLSMQSSEGGPQIYLRPENPSTFFITKDDSYVFSKEGEQVTQLAIRNGQNEVLARRMP